MIKITHEQKIVDGEVFEERFVIGRDNTYSAKFQLTVNEAHELHTALGEKLKEIENK